MHELVTINTDLTGFFAGRNTFDACLAFYPVMKEDDLHST